MYCFLFAVSAAAEELIFHEAFDALDLDRWHHEVTMSGSGNREFEAYVNSRSNSFVKDGTLYIKPTLLGDEVTHGAMNLTDAGCRSPNWWDCYRNATVDNVLPPVLSAHLDSRESFAFKYGRLEVRAKLPSASWTWPAIWLMSRNDKYGGWPASGEIDLMESRGNVDYACCGLPMGNNVFGSTLHWGPAFDKNGWPLTTNSSPPLDRTLHDDFHTFGLFWTDTELFTYLDDETNVVTRIPFYGKTSFWEQGTRSGVWDANDVPNCYAGAPPNAPFDQPFYIILNVAAGGTSPGKPGTPCASGYFPDDCQGKPWHTTDLYPHTHFWRARASFADSWHGDNAAMQIDDIKVWAFPGLSAYYTASVASYHHHHRSNARAFWLITGMALAFGLCALAMYVRSRFASTNLRTIAPFAPSYAALNKVDEFVLP